MSFFAVKKPWCNCVLYSFHIFYNYLHCIWITDIILLQMIEQGQLLIYDFKLLKNLFTVLITSCISWSSPISFKSLGLLEFRVPVVCLCCTESESKRRSAIFLIVSGSLRNTSKSEWTSNN